MGTEPKTSPLLSSSDHDTLKKSLFGREIQEFRG
jgi:hypothetical protein